jgi:hypothetical protein
MDRFRLFTFSLLLLCPLASLAQAGGGTPPPSATSPSVEAKQFDFMLGQWELEVHPKVSGLAAMIHGTPRLIGTWKAWRAANGADIVDEMRIVDGSGNPLSLIQTLRAYDTVQRRWIVSGRDVSKGRNSVASGELRGSEMHQDGYVVDAEGKTLTRTRYYNIQADSFHMTQDRSTDNGQSWEEGSLSIDAKRMAAPSRPE